MTGATAGFGAVTARWLLDAGADLTVGARDPGGTQVPPGARVQPLDLDSLEAVRRFAAAAGEGAPVDVLICNAGLQLRKPARSADGFERTFAVNHLSHYLLIRLMLPCMAKGGRILLTGSGTHDPAEKTPVTSPRHADAERLAHPDRDPARPRSELAAGFFAYSSSKLCNIMTARELAVRHPEVASIAFDPGYVPGTRLGRESPAPIAWLVGKIVPFTMRRDRTSTVDDAGREYARLASDPAFAGDRGAYWAMRGVSAIPIEPSDLARDAAASSKLWDDSARLAGL
jgi:NAD(P)-dependent dehydrogenase (short-subunit alcohol dehydrogenase family)